MTDQLTESQIDAFIQAFNEIDEDNSRTISTKELGIIMRQLGHNPTEAELQDMMSEVDSDGSGSIDFPEFLAMMSSRMRSSQDADDIKPQYFEIRERNLRCGKSILWQERKNNKIRSAFSYAHLILIF